MLLSLKSSFYILDDTPLSDVSLANISFQYLASLLIALTLTFTEQEFLILLKFSLMSTFLMNCNFGVVSLAKFSFMLSSECFITFVFYIWFCDPFELIFVQSASSISRCIFLHVNNQFAGTFCWRDYLCSIILPLLLCHRSVDCIYTYGRLFLVSLFCHIYLFVYFFTSTALSWLLQFEVR